MKRLLWLVLWIASVNSYAIEGGSVTDEPYIAALVVKDLPYVNESFGIDCSATLIHPEWMLTTASCLQYLRHDENGFTFLFYRPSEVKYFAANDTIPFLPDFTDNAAKGIDDIIIHPDFSVEIIGDEVFDKNDIALLRLKSPSLLTPIELYAGNDLLRNTEGLAIGWDLYNPPLGIATTAAFSISAPTASEYSSDWCPSDIEAYSFCAGLKSDSVYTSFDDEGGPLSYFDGSADVLIGILSDTAYDELEYDIYTRISTVRDFVEDTISNYVPDGGLCFPIKSTQGTVSIICL